MEQRKSDINTGDGNVVNVDTNGLSYSFDFSNQVDNTSQVVQPEATAQVAQEQPATAQVASVQPATAQAESAESEATAQVAPVQPATVQAESVEPEATSQVAPVQPATSQGESVEPGVTQTEHIKASEDDGEILIKDKKSTKFFLIILFALVIGFIICLPKLHEIISNII